jgi:hypothetical protein
MSIIASTPAESLAPSSVSSRNSRFVDTEFLSFEIALQVNMMLRLIRSFSPSENDANEKVSRNLLLITSLKFSSRVKSTNNSNSDRYWLINLFMIGIYVLMILVLIPPSLSIAATIERVSRWLYSLVCSD